MDAFGQPQPHQHPLDFIQACSNEEMESEFCHVALARTNRFSLRGVFQPFLSTHQRPTDIIHNISTPNSQRIQLSSNLRQTSPEHAIPSRTPSRPSTTPHPKSPTSTVEFMSIENLKTFGKSNIPLKSSSIPSSIFFSGHERARQQIFSRSLVLESICLLARLKTRFHLIFCLQRSTANIPSHRPLRRSRRRYRRDQAVSKLHTHPYSA